MVINWGASNTSQCIPVSCLGILSHFRSPEQERNLVTSHSRAASPNHPNLIPLFLLIPRITAIVTIAYHSSMLPTFTSRSGKPRKPRCQWRESTRCIPGWASKRCSKDTGPMAMTGWGARLFVGLCWSFLSMKKPLVPRNLGVSETSPR